MAPVSTVAARTANHRRRWRSVLPSQARARLRELGGRLASIGCHRRRQVSQNVTDESASSRSVPRPFLLTHRGHLCAAGFTQPNESQDTTTGSHPDAVAMISSSATHSSIAVCSNHPSSRANRRSETNTPTVGDSPGMSKFAPPSGIRIVYGWTKLSTGINPSKASNVSFPSVRLGSVVAAENHNVRKVTALWWERRQRGGQHEETRSHTEAAHRLVAALGPDSKERTRSARIAFPSETPSAPPCL